MSDNLYLSLHVSKRDTENLFKSFADEDEACPWVGTWSEGFGGDFILSLEDS